MLENTRNSVEKVRKYKKFGWKSEKIQEILLKKWANTRNSVGKVRKYKKFCHIYMYIWYGMHTKFSNKFSCHVCHVCHICMYVWYGMVWYAYTHTSFSLPFSRLSYLVSLLSLISRLSYITSLLHTCWMTFRVAKQRKCIIQHYVWLAVWICIRFGVCMYAFTLLIVC